ncbi:hypothetical protein SATMO3_11790 [Sporomusa aerivorans]
MKVIRSATNLHCPKCGNDIATTTKTVSLDTILADNRPIKCYWPKCGWAGKMCDVAPSNPT